MITRARSYLYVPGDRPDRFDKAIGSGADAIVLDLEDAVALSRKDLAVTEVGNWLRFRTDRTVPAYVRVNPGARLSYDVQVAVSSGADGIWLPKCESRQSLIDLDALITDVEDRNGIYGIRVSPLLETGAGILAAEEIAASPRVTFVQIGEVDLAADLGIDPSPSGNELLWARSRVVSASAAAAIASPVGAASTVIRDLEAFTAETEALRRMGFRGRACIHPAQIAPVHAVYTPTAADVERARSILVALENAASGVAVDSEGRLIDEAVARNARRVLAHNR